MLLQRRMRHQPGVPVLFLAADVGSVAKVSVLGEGSKWCLCAWCYDMQAANRGLDV